MTDDDQKKAKGRPRLLGKWDLIVCAILSFLSRAGQPHTFGFAQAPAEWIEQWIGAFIGMVLIWTIVKSIALWIRRLISSKKETGIHKI